VLTSWITYRKKTREAINLAVPRLHRCNFRNALHVMTNTTTTTNNKMKTPTVPVLSSSSSTVAALPLFVYGTLISPIVMESIIERKSIGRPARLLPSSFVSATNTNTTTMNNWYDYSRHPVRGHVYPGLVHWNTTTRTKSTTNKNSVVDPVSQYTSKARNYVCGLLYTDLTDTELQLLDTYEGDPYSREQCHVEFVSQHDEVVDHCMILDTTKNPIRTDQSSIVLAMVYVWSNPLSELDLSNDWSYATFELEHLENYI
jgi:Gamma-glutamyl cyclotransferase, AIG2-like